MARGDWWTFDGWSAARHLDPLAMPLERYLNLIWHWATDQRDAKALERFRRWLYMKLPWQVDDEDLDEDSPWSPEAQNASLRGFKAKMGAVPAPDAGKTS